MGLTVLLCTDGSDPAIDALRQSLPLLAEADRTVLLHVATPVEPKLDTGKGFATGPHVREGFEQVVTSGDEAAKRLLDHTVTALGLTDADLLAIVGDPAKTICDVAASLPASLVVMGTRGRGGLRRAVGGSTADYVVRNAPCPVLVRGPT
jgi:nucleotide-binding universal stress UspA family protein